MPASDGLQFWDADISLSTSAALLHNPAALLNPYGGNPLDLTIFVSCYNESAYINTTLATIRDALREVGRSYEVIVIDDGSKDNSLELVKDYIAAHPDERIMLRANKKNKGLAQNYIDGAFLGRGKYYRLICGDNSEPKETLVAVFGAIGEADIIVPYYATSEGRSFSRILISKTFTFIINLITGYHFHYYNGLAVHLRYNVLRWHPNTRGFGFQADILCLLLDLGFSFKEIPVITVENREGNSSALTFRNLLSVAHTITEIFLRRISNRIYKRNKLSGG